MNKYGLNKIFRYELVDEMSDELDVKVINRFEDFRNKLIELIAIKVVG